MSLPQRFLPRRAPWWAVAAVLVALAAPAEGQVGAARANLTTAAEAARAATSARRSLDRMALEGPLDADAYRVGPGDVFTVTVGGSLPRQTEAVVSADGTLAVPEAGSFAVAGRTLREVQRTVGGALGRRYQNVPTDVTLASPRVFYVHV